MGNGYKASIVLSPGVLVCRLSVIILWRRLLLFPVHEIADDGSEIWKFVGKVDDTVPAVERAPCNDSKLYDLILLP